MLDLIVFIANIWVIKALKNDQNSQKVRRNGKNEAQTYCRPCSRARNDFRASLAVLPGQYENVIEALETITKERNELKVTNAACVQEISTMKSQLSDLNAKNQN